MARFSYEFCCNFGFCFYSTGFLFSGRVTVFHFGVSHFGLKCEKPIFQKQKKTKYNIFLLKNSSQMFSRKVNRINWGVPESRSSWVIRQKMLYVSIVCTIITWSRSCPYFSKNKEPSSCFLQSVKVICTFIFLFCLFVLSGREQGQAQDAIFSSQ